MLSRTEKQEIIDIIAKEFASQAKRILDDSNHVYEFKKVDFDAELTLNVIQKLGAEGWRYAFSSRDLGLKDKNYLIFQRAKENRDQLDPTPLEEAEVSEPKEEEELFGKSVGKVTEEDDL